VEVGSRGVFTSILCPVDFSEHSERALGVALELAALTGAHLTLVHVVDALLDAASRATHNGEALEAQTQQELQDLLQRIATAAGKEPRRIAIAVAVGDPAEQVLKQAVECESDLIVIGTQGLEGARRLVFGSTTEGVLRASRVPVLAVPLPPA
jgi:nucleotide-binding universal stress UspA family protein